ncbi:MAG: GGDEF domain-containing protein [Uliginosibacterium sp.]|nr:GGDEF domain-containing protein [Uliginosibacterium sp.]
MTLRTAILWQPDGAWRVGMLLVSMALIVLLAYLHTLAGLAYEVHVFFAPPLALVAWFIGLRVGLVAAVIVVALWFRADQLLGSDEASAMPLILNSLARLLIYCAGVWLMVQLRKLLDAETQLARKDMLTHLPNRREFFELGRQALAQAHREGTPFTAVFIDLDKFKEVNDTRGHAAGDALLVCVANGLSGRLRTSDIAGRLGGDEFALLLPGMDGTSAKVYIEDLQHRLLQAMNERQWPVTFSIGVASYAHAPADLDALVAEADGLMYEVKCGSRNRVLQKDFPAP